MFNEATEISKISDSFKIPIDKLVEKGNNVEIYYKNNLLGQLFRITNPDLETEEVSYLKDSPSLNILWRNIHYYHQKELESVIGIKLNWQIVSTTLAEFPNLNVRIMGKTDTKLYECLFMEGKWRVRDVTP